MGNASCRKFSLCLDVVEMLSTTCRRMFAAYSELRRRSRWTCCRRRCERCMTADRRMTAARHWLSADSLQPTRLLCATTQTPPANHHQSQSHHYSPFRNISPTRRVLKFILQRRTFSNSLQFYNSNLQCLKNFRTCQAEAIRPIATHFSIAWSVCLSSVTFTLLKPFDGFRCHLAGTIPGANDTLWVPDPPRKWKIWRGGRTIANCSQTVSPTLPPGEYKRGVRWTCHSDSAFCRITLVLVVIYLALFFETRC